MEKWDLYIEYARVLKMCKGTGVNPGHCWKFCGQERFDTPVFRDDPKCYEFAVAILKDRPVFVGDKVWLKELKIYSRATEYDHCGIINDNCCSWDEPKKTIKLNGVELPMPSGSGYTYIMIDGEYYWFNSHSDRFKVVEAIKNLLKGK